MGIAFLPLYIRYLGMEAYGLIGFFAVMQAWLALMDMGMTPTLNREMARFTAGVHTACSIGNLLRSLEAICVVIALIVCAGIWSVSHWLASDWLRVDKLPVDEVAHAVTVMAWVLALRLIEGLYRGALLGLQKQVWLNGMGAVLATGRWGGAVLVLSWISPSIKAFFLWQGLISGLSVLIFAVAVHRTLPECEKPLRFSTEAIRSVGRFASGMMATTVLALLLTQVDKILLSRLLNLETFGHYTFAATVAGALLMLVAPVAQAFYPHLTELATKEEATNLADTYHLGAQLVSVLIVPAALMMAVFGQAFLALWTGNDGLAQSTASLLALLALGTMLNGFMHIPYMLQLAHGWSGLAARVNVVAVSILIPAIFWVAPRYGALGAAWVWFALNAGYVFIGIHFMHFRLLPTEKIRWYLQDLAMPAICSALAIGMSYALQPSGLDRIGILAWLAGTLALAYVAAMMGASTYRKLIFRRMGWTHAR